MNTHDLREGQADRGDRGRRLGGDGTHGLAHV